MSYHDSFFNHSTLTIYSVFKLYKFNFRVAPSRNIDHARPWEDDDGFSYRSSVGPSYNGKLPLNV